MHDPNTHVKQFYDMHFDDLILTIYWPTWCATQAKEPKN